MFYFSFKFITLLHFSNYCPLTKAIFLFIDITATWTKSTHLLEKSIIALGQLLSSTKGTQKRGLVLPKLKGKACICISDFLNLKSLNLFSILTFEEKKKNLGLPSYLSVAGDICSLHCAFTLNKIFKKLILWTHSFKYKTDM